MEQKYNRAFAFSEEVYLKWSEPILRQVFLHDDPFSDCVNPLISEKLILYPIWTQPEGQLLEAIFLSMREIGDEGCFLTNFTRTSYDDGSLCEDGSNHCYISAIDLESFLVGQYLVDIFFESVYYSASGKWGLMISHEHHGVLCGCSEFMASIKSLIPDLDSQISLWLTYFKEVKIEDETCGYGSLTLEWLPDLLKHIYGVSYANRLLNEFELGL